MCGNRDFWRTVDEIFKGVDKVWTTDAVHDAETKHPNGYFFHIGYFFLADLLRGSCVFPMV
jgi:hypothetical protein